MLRRDSDATSLATGESVSRVNSQHDPKTIQMDLMMGREAARGCRSLFRPLGSVSWIKFLFPRHGRCWAKPIQSGHAVQRKRCGEAARRRRTLFRPSGSVSWNLAGHWWEPSGAHRGCARPKQDSTFSKKWCCKNGAGASQATGESFFKQNFGNEGQAMKTT